LNRRNRSWIPVVALVVLVAVAGCSKKTQPLAPEPAEMAPPAAAAAVPQAPIAQLTATPTVISAGDQVQLSWRTSDANHVVIDGIGEVPSAGVKTVTPTVSTTYHLVARGEAGSADASARVTVNPPPAVAVPVSTISAEEVFKSNVQDIFFDYDTYTIRPEAQAVLERNAAFLAKNPDVKIVIGGYCDERGSNDYNLALGNNRADAAKNALVTAGVAASRIRVISYGKEKPFCTESTEECWQQNRRDGFTIEH